MKKRKKITNKQKETFLIVSGSFLSTLVLIFSLFALSFVMKSDDPNNMQFKTFMFFMFLSMSLLRIPMTLSKMGKLNLIRNSIVAIGYLAFAFTSLFINVSIMEYCLIGSFFALTIIANRIIKIVDDRSVRSVITNAFILLFAGILLLIFITSINGAGLDLIILLTLLLLVITSISLFDVLYFCLSRIKFQAMAKIVKKTFAIEVLYGLFILVIASSVTFYIFEDNIATFGDALWYSFAIVTTIGFGDFYATSALCRIISVILGIYGLVVVAVLTSIIVNFYNETSKKEAEDDKNKKDIDEVIAEQAEKESDKNKK